MLSDTELLDDERHGGAGSISDAPSPEEEADALRWRKAILHLSQNLLTAAANRNELAPYLLEAMHNALDNLLVHGREDDLMALEEWLEHEADLIR